MGWLGDACKCGCGWACDPTDESDTIRKCEKCGTIFERKSYGWCQMDKLMWWGYLHQNGSIQVKRWFGDHKDYTDDCIGNSFVQQVVRPFEANTREEAYMIIERELDGEITGQ